MAAVDCSSKDREGYGMTSCPGRSQYVSARVGGVNDVLSHIVVRVSEDGVETWSCADVLGHHPGADIIRWRGALVPVRSDPMNSPIVEGK